MLKSIKEVSKALGNKEISVSKLCDRAHRIIEDTHNLNAFITTKHKDDIKEEAERLDKMPDNRGPLYGIPISIKDNFCTENMLTTCASKMLSNFVPPYDATIVHKLKQAQCIITGKTNMDEFAMGSSCTTSYYKPSANSWKSEAMRDKSPCECDLNEWYLAGGSSAGSAVSVATGACFASIGTDTGGSTRQPASFTGTVGFKPTYGLISRFGLVPLAHSLDVVSILARSTDDVGLVFSQIIGQDENDLTTVDHNVVLESCLKSLDGQRLRVGIPDNFVSKSDLTDEVARQYAQIIKSLSSKSFRSTGFELVNVDLPHCNLATECYTIISSAEIASNMSCFDGVKYGNATSAEGLDRDDFFKANRDEAFGSEVKKRILLGNYFLLEGNREKYLNQAHRARRLISQDFENVFDRVGCHVILLPSTPTTSITYNEWLNKQDDNKLFREDFFLIPANLANVPAISLPSGLARSTGLPIGLQLVANRFHDLDLLLIAKFFEEHVLEKMD